MPSAKKSDDSADKDKLTEKQDESTSGLPSASEKTAEKSRKVVKADDDDDDEDDDELENSDDGEDEDEDDEDEDKASKARKSVRKSQLTGGDLRKSIRKLRAFADENDQSGRKNSLLEKARGSSLSKSEKKELYALLDGTSQTEALGSQMRKSLDPDERTQEQLDVSDFLTAQHEGLLKSLGTLGEAVEGQGNRQNEFNLLLAKAVSDVGQSLRSLNSRLGQIETQPARAPKSAGVRPLAKSFGNQPERAQLSKSQVLDALTAMNEAACQNGGAGLSKSGIDLTHAISKCEQTGHISPALQRDLSEHLQAARG